MRVIRSAIGSVIINSSSLLPARFGDARDLPLEAQESEANAAHSEPAQKAAHTPTERAAVVVADRKFLLRRGLVAQCLSRHAVDPPAPQARNGMPRCRSSALPSSLVGAVVTNVMSM